MGAKSEQVKGHAKEVAGIVTGDKDLKSEGTADRLAGEADEMTEQGRHTVEGGLDRVRTIADDGLDKTKQLVDTGLDKTKHAVDAGVDKTKHAVDAGVDRAKGLLHA